VLSGLGRARVLVAVVTLLGVSLTSVGSSVEASPKRASIVLELTRTTAGPSSFDLTLFLSYNAKGGEGFIAEVGGRRSSGGFAYVEPGFVSSAGRSDNRTVSVHGQQVSACDHSSALCFNQTTLNGLFLSSTSYSDTGAAGSITTWYAVAEGVAVKYEFRGKGWKVRRVVLPYRFVDGSDGQIAAHAAVVDGVEVFDRPVTARGGRWGSLALAAPPCSTSAVSVVPRGVARLTLRGGRTIPVAECPNSASNPNKGAWAPAATTWTLDGYAVGETALAETRAFVLDLPRR
jgi:hypothetical protein